MDVRDLDHGQQRQQGKTQHGDRRQSAQLCRPSTAEMCRKSRQIDIPCISRIHSLDARGRRRVPPGVFFSAIGPVRLSCCRVSFRPSGRAVSFGTYSEDCASLHPGLFSCPPFGRESGGLPVPSGSHATTFADANALFSRPIRQRRKARLVYTVGR
jgi:hypothetical protein